LPREGTGSGSFEPEGIYAIGEEDQAAAESKKRQKQDGNEVPLAEEQADEKATEARNPCHGHEGLPEDNCKKMLNR
jgi:hypothetical protein